MSKFWTRMWDKVSVVSHLVPLGLIWFGPYCAARFYKPVTIVGSSMSPELNPDPKSPDNEMLLFKRYNVQEELKRGDVVLCRNVLPTENKNFIVKRVIALEGDEVIPRRTNFGFAQEDSDEVFFEQPLIPKRIPRGFMWLEGDNQETSVDSNVYGPVPRALIEGRALYFVTSQESRRGFFEKVASFIPEPDRLIIGEAIPL